MKKQYFELNRLIERLHRRFIDVLKTELNRIGVRNINGVQALLLSNIGEEKITIRDLVERGYYLGSNVSYNIKKLTDLGYLNQEPTPPRPPLGHRQPDRKSLGGRPVLA